MAENRQCARCAARASWIGLWDSLVLSVMKGVVGILTGSRALIASALYSVHDMVSAIAVIIGLRVAKRPADQEHPYGHGHAEHIVCVFTSVLILVATVFLMGDSVRILFRGESRPAHWAVLGVAVISLVANELLCRYNMCAVRQMNSPALLAHGKHHRADAFSSAAVIVAVIASHLGFHFVDALVAVFEGGHLILVSLEILYQGGSGLMDRSIAESQVAQIRRAVADMDAVTEIRDIKTRQVGRRVSVDLYVSLPGERTIAEVHTISRKIRQSIETRIEHFGDVNVICV